MAALKAFVAEKIFPWPDFRTGGLRGRTADPVGKYFEETGKITIRDANRSGVWLHETVHLWQHLNLGTEGMFIQGMVDKVPLGPGRTQDPYTTYGTLEYQAVWYEHYYSVLYGYPYARRYVPTTPMPSLEQLR